MEGGRESPPPRSLVWGVVGEGEGLGGMMDRWIREDWMDELWRMGWMDCTSLPATPRHGWRGGGVN